ncbi:PREDICTED: rab9 effector protein with kelch motifs-like [Amphimedon queenslandica]|uniref:Rab9 effector protein with kelch motifs n=1 Tax=Amphimedon queenslandica TaxID=400682 RepID=A0AAN0JMN5_AMPQE|nr:PREDICTED: rab9 effector protein with kelch motifs-like [Amphimedon queenslandica]|eukprot:XP_019858042.1 PREDICTED: rab9 effector protein with kelch motifs-like [Amphimedon queenslandica]
MASKNYQPVKRWGHSTVKVGDYLYMWGGSGSGVDYDVMEVYHLPTGAWDQKPTTGTPPPGTWVYSSVAIGKDIYYFGGRGAGDSGYQYQNSLHCLNVDSFKWRELSPSSDYDPMKKGFCGIISVHFDGEHYLVIIGGLGSSSTPKQPNAQYNNSFGDLRCNEIHYYRISSGGKLSQLLHNQQLQYHG